MHPTRTAFIAVVTSAVGALLIITTEGPAGATPPTAAGCDLTREPASVRSAMPGTGAAPRGGVNAVSAVSPDDVWAVGRLDGSAVAEHWDGTKWRGYALPELAGARRVNVLSVSARTGSDVWAVGDAKLTRQRGWRTITYHWDGTEWTRVRSPTPGSAFQVSLEGVDAASADDAVAVGTQFVSASCELRPIALHWDGRRWSLVDVPRSGRGLFQRLLGVTALSPTDAWAVGDRLSLTGRSRVSIEHWDGSAWRVASTPEVAGESWLAGVDAAGPRDLFAVGGRPNEQGTTLVEHGNGRRWTVQGSANPEPGSFLTTVSAASSQEVWAAGFASYGGTNLVQRYDGSSWQAVDPPTAGDFRGLTGVAAVAHDDVWVVGFYRATGGAARPDLEHWDGQDWTRYPAGIPHGHEGGTPSVATTGRASR